MDDFLLRLYIFCKRDRAQTMAEYAVVLGIITAALVLAMGALGGSVSGALAKVTRDL